MGLHINVDLDTNLGPTNEAYIRIETCRINKVLAQLEFTTTCWVDKDSADKFYRTYLDDSFANSNGLLTKEVVYYKNENDKKGTEVVIENYYKVSTVKNVTIEEPVYETKVVTKTVPYVSFDENGEEVIKEKEIETEEKVQVGTNTVEKQLIDYSLMEKPFEFAYKYLKSELTKIFPKSKIVQL